MHIKFKLKKMKLFNNKIYLRKTKKVDMFTINNKLNILAFFTPLLILLFLVDVLLYNNINELHIS